LIAFLLRLLFKLQVRLRNTAFVLGDSFDDDTSAHVTAAVICAVFAKMVLETLEQCTLASRARESRAAVALRTGIIGLGFVVVWVDEL
jgi:hypothetical protein